MKRPVLFHDPTSEPSRAVHWLTIEAGIELEIRPTWLSRHDHERPDFLRVNPGYQVPALEHDGFAVAEASAIMLYLADLHRLHDTWVGTTPEARAWTHRFRVPTRSRRVFSGEAPREEARDRSSRASCLTTVRSRDDQGGGLSFIGSLPAIRRRADLGSAQAYLPPGRSSRERSCRRGRYIAVRG